MGVGRGAWGVGRGAWGVGRGAWGVGAREAERRAALQSTLCSVRFFDVVRALPMVRLSETQ